MPPVSRWLERNWLPLGLTIVLALAGGASRADASSQVVVRSVAVLAICVALARRPDSEHPGNVAAAFTFLGAVAALILVQLAPLPPSVWGALSGRDVYERAAVILQAKQPWRPLNLTPDLGWNAFLALLPATAVITLIARWPRRFLSASAALLWITATLSALLGLAQMAGGQESVLRFYEYTNASAPVGFLANRNHQAALLACALPAIAYWVSQGSWPHLVERQRFAVGAATTLVLLVTLVATGSRAGMALGGLSSIVALYFWKPVLSTRFARVSTRNKMAALGLCMMLVASLIVIVILAGRAQSIDRLVAGQEADMRRVWFAPSKVMLETFLPWGSGFGSFAAVFPRFESYDVLRWNYANQAHNDWLQIVIEAGAPGAALALAYLIWWGVRSLRVWRTRTNPSAALGRLGSAVTGVLMLASIVDYPLRTPILSALFALASLWLLLAKDARAASPPGRTDPKVLYPA